MKLDLLRCAIYFLFISFLLSCKKTNNGSTSNFYLKGTINGIYVEWNAPHSSSNAQFRVAMSDPSGAMPLNGPCFANDSNYQFHLGTAIYEYHTDAGIDFRNSISVDFSKSGSSTTPGDPKYEMQALFTNGAKNFGILRLSCADPVFDGITISYTDNNNKSWRSNILNSSDYFEQISLTNKQGNGFYEKEWKAKFSCRLYDDLGSYIYAENCEIFGPVFAL